MQPWNNAPSRTGIHDRRAEFAKIVDGVLDDIDTFLVGLGEQLPSHVFTNHAYPDSVQPLRRGEADIGLRRPASDAKHGRLVLRVVAGDYVQYFCRILHVAANRTGPHVQTRSHHSFPADQVQRRCEPNQAVHGCRPSDRHNGFFTDGAGHQVCRYRCRRARARHAGFAFRVVRITEGPAKGTTRAVRCIFG